MDYVAYAVPFFLLLIVIEIAWGLLRKNNTYRVNDSLNSLSLGMLSTLTKLIFLNVGMLIFTNIESNYALMTVDMTSPAHWVIGFLAYDFCYYWFHRISHERTLFWGSHVVHHQSEDFNLSTALRQTSTGVFTTWVFYLPLFFLGMPIEMYVSIASIHLIYQFWIHTQFVPKLGPLEWFLITPSNHRVHHAQNTYYVDRNYGGLLCIWDRLFGTFREENEDEAIIYGITTPLNTWNPIWANVHIFTGMLRDAFFTKKISDKFRILYARTGWRPDDVKARFPDTKSDQKNFRKYDPPLSVSNKMAITMQYFVATLCYFWLVTSAPQLSGPVVLIGFTLALFTLVSIGLVADQSHKLVLWEYCRLIATAAVLLLAYSLNLAEREILIGGATYALVSGGLSWVAIWINRSPTTNSLVDSASTTG